MPEAFGLSFHLQEQKEKGSEDEKALEVEKMEEDAEPKVAWISL